MRQILRGQSFEKKENQISVRFTMYRLKFELLKGKENKNSHWLFLICIFEWYNYVAYGFGLGKSRYSGSGE